MFGKKITDQKKLNEIQLGPNRLIHSDSVESDLRYVEHTGASISAGQEHLTDLEQKMAMWGLQLLMPKTGNITATEKALSSGESDSTLKSWAVMFKDFIVQALVYTMRYFGEPKGGSVYVNTEFRWMQTLDAEVLLRAGQFKMLSRKVVFEELQRRGIIGDDVVFEEMVKQLDEEQQTQMQQQTQFGQYTSVSTDPTKSVVNVSSSYGIKRGSGRKGGV